MMGTVSLKHDGDYHSANDIQFTERSAFDLCNAEGSGPYASAPSVPSRMQVETARLGAHV
jgi:hypothetical protein